MVKRILAGTLAALVLVGCGGSGNSGTAFAFGVDAAPDQTGISITANGSTVLSNASFTTPSPQWISVSSGTNATIFATNSAGQQYAGGLYPPGFISGNYYYMYAYGNNNTTGQLAVLPIDVSPPAAGTCRVMFVNVSANQQTASVDVYLNPSTAVAPTPPATAFGINANNSGATTQAEFNNIPPNTYNVYFCLAGTQTVVASYPNVTLGSTLTGAGENVIQVIAMTDAPGTTRTVTQQALAPIVVTPVTGTSSPLPSVRPFIFSGSKVISKG